MEESAMTPLRQRMVEDMKIRRFSASRTSVPREWRRAEEERPTAVAEGYPERGLEPASGVERRPADYESAGVVGVSL